MEEELSVGFRFYPTEVELVSFYLRTQLGGGNVTIHSLIPILDVFGVEPTQLPYLAGERCRGYAEAAEQWLFFVPRQEREARGGRPSRTTGSGYWKATGSPGPVFSPDNRVIGVKKTMVFYTGKAPTGRKTKWKMNEYKAVDETFCSVSTFPKLRHEFSLCRIYIKSGSSRAFDRRPTETYGLERKLPSYGTKTLSHARISTSPETSYLGRDQVNLLVNATTTQSNLEMVDVLSQLREKTLPSNGVETSSCATISTSPETSYSGEDQVDFSVSVTTTQCNSVMVDGLSQPFWEWEQLNWS